MPPGIDRECLLLPSWLADVSVNAARWLLDESWPEELDVEVSSPKKRSGAGDGVCRRCRVAFGVSSLAAISASIAMSWVAPDSVVSNAGGRSRCRGVPLEWERSSSKSPADELQLVSIGTMGDWKRLGGR